MNMVFEFDKRHIGTCIILFTQNTDKNLPH